MSKPIVFGDRGSAALFTIWGSSFVDRDVGTIVFDLETAAVGVAIGTIVRHHPRKTLVRLAEHAQMALNGTALTG